LEQTFPKFTGLTSSLINKIKAWEGYIEGGKFGAPLPEDWDRKLDLFDKVLLSRVLQPQKIVSAMSYYISNTIGQQYLDPPNVTIRDLWKDSDSKTPIIFVLSPGADPTSGLLKFAESSEIQTVIQIISLGQGQGGPAENLIKKAKINGKWVLL
jgi:dynein heavy chain, axonemal